MVFKKSQVKHSPALSEGYAIQPRLKLRSLLRDTLNMINRRISILLRISTSLLHFWDAARLSHLQGISCNLGLLLFTDTIPVARDMLVAEQRPDLFQSSSFGFLLQDQYQWTTEKLGPELLTGNKNQIAAT